MTRSLLLPSDRKKPQGGQPCAFEGCPKSAYRGNLYCGDRHWYKNKAAKKRAVTRKEQHERKAELGKHDVSTLPAGLDGAVSARVERQSLTPISDKVFAGVWRLLERERVSQMRSESFRDIAMNIADTVSQKNEAYGDSFSSAGPALRLLFPGGIRPGRMDEALSIARVWDKLSRIATNNDPAGESPWLDIAGYAILALSRLQPQSAQPSQENGKCASASESDAPTSSKTTTDSAAGSAES